MDETHFEPFGEYHDRFLYRLRALFSACAVHRSSNALEPGAAVPGKFTNDLSSINGLGRIQVFPLMDGPSPLRRVLLECDSSDVEDPSARIPPTAETARVCHAASLVLVRVISWIVC